MKALQGRRGHYLGKEVGGKWWRRYRNDGLLARGIGEWWMDGKALFFRRDLIDAVIVIQFKDVAEVKVGKWHSGRWAGGSTVVKILWKKEGRLLSSGFVFCRDPKETEELVEYIRSLTTKGRGQYISAPSQ
ncbi:MAG: hypothetical protein QXS68_06285 [Candidatus Methanomethylicaceae archaeon]